MKVFILNGPTASGKTSLMDYLLLNDADFLEPIISFTTRPPKKHETDKRNYYFISSAEYLQYRLKGQIVEEITYLDHQYGVTKDELSRVNKTRKNGLAIMNTEGIRNFKKNLGAQNVVSIFIYRDLKDIITSIMGRDASEQEIGSRIDLAKTEMLDITSCDYVVYNIGSLAEAYDQVVNIIKKELNTRPINMEIKPGDRYRHFKGDVYEIITTALYTENYCPLVVYKDINTGIDYARPYELFCGKKELKTENRIVNRFELIKE
jgi:guanylate kinase